MKDLDISALVAALLAAPVGAQEWPGTSRHCAGTPAHEHSIYGKRPSAGRPLPNPYGRDEEDPAGEMLAGCLLRAFGGNALAGDSYGRARTITGATLITATGYAVGKD